jgi:hypothetical protein
MASVSAIKKEKLLDNYYFVDWVERRETHSRQFENISLVGGLCKPDLFPMVGAFCKRAYQGGGQIN